MDEQLKNDILKSLEELNQYLLWSIKDRFGVTISKARTAVWSDDGKTIMESELHMDEPELFKQAFEKYLKKQILEEAKKAHKE